MVSCWPTQVEQLELNKKQQVKLVDGQWWKCWRAKVERVNFEFRRPRCSKLTASRDFQPEKSIQIQSNVDIEPIVLLKVMSSVLIPAITVQFRNSGEKKPPSRRRKLKLKEKLRAAPPGVKLKSCFFAKRMTKSISVDAGGHRMKMRFVIGCKVAGWYSDTHTLHTECVCRVISGSLSRST